MTGRPKPWEPERVVTPALASDLILRQFPELGPVQVEPVGEGFDNTVFRVNRQAIFRFPRRSVAVRCLEQETRLLPLLADRLPLRVPLPRWIGKPEPEFFWPFVGAPEIPGVVAHRAALSNRQRSEIAPVLGRFLAALHALPLEPLRAAGALGDEWGRLDVTVRRPRALAIIEALSSKALPNETASAVSRVLEETSVSGERAIDVILHGDLYGAQLLVDSAGALCGVIDWGDVHIGNRAVDLAIAFEFLPPEAREGFFRAYGDVDAETRALARFRAATHALLLADYALQTSSASLADEALRGLRWVAAS